MGLPAPGGGGGGSGALGPPWGTILAIGIVEIAMPRLGGLEATSALRHVWIRKLYPRIAAAERVTPSAPRSSLALSPSTVHRHARLRGAEQACTRRGAPLLPSTVTPWTTTAHRLLSAPLILAAPRAPRRNAHDARATTTFRTSAASGRTRRPSLRPSALAAPLRQLHLGVVDACYVVIRDAPCHVSNLLRSEYI